MTIHAHRIARTSSSVIAALHRKEGIYYTRRRRPAAKNSHSFDAFMDATRFMYLVIDREGDGKCYRQSRVVVLASSSRVSISRLVSSDRASVVHRSIATPASSTLVTRASSPANPRARRENNKRITAHHTHSLY